MPIPNKGWVLHVVRQAQQKRAGQSYQRTVSRYQVYRDGVAAPGLSGWFAERQGPGDNKESGDTHDRRIEAKTYRLATHKGGRTDKNGVTLYITHGYSTDPSNRANLRPSIKLLDTGSRGGVLFHPGSGWLWSIGCFNPGADLSAADGNLAWLDSRKRVIALIDDMKAYLGARFPASNNVRIPDAWMVIEGEPPAVP
jgi:hypothetical protein